MQTSPDSASPHVAPRWAVPAAILLIGLATLLAYANSFTAGYTLDNHIIVEADPRLRAATWVNFENIFTQSYWWPYEPSQLYRPLTTLSYMVNYSVLGNGPRTAGYHWINFLAHWANASLVFLLLRRLAGSLRYALVAAGLFAVHPVATESVTNLVGRADEFATIGILAGYLCHLRAAANHRWHRLPWLAGLGVCGFFAMFSKENGLLLAVLLPLHDWLFRWPKLAGDLRQRLETAWREFVLWGYLALVPAVVLRLWMHYKMVIASPLYGEFFVDNPIAHAPQPQAFLTAIKVLGRYLALLVFPHTLSCDYSYNAIPLYGDDAPFWEDLQSWAALAVVTGLLTLAWRRRQTQPLISLGIFYFFLMMALTSNVFVAIGSIMGERFLYMPLVGFCIVAAPVLLALGEDIARRLDPPPLWRPWAVLAFPALVLAVMGVRSFARNADWQNDYTLWRSAVHAMPESFKVHKGYAFELWRHQPDEAGIDAAIFRAEIGVAVLDSHPLPLPRQDNTLFNDLGAFYVRKAEYLQNRKENSEAQRYYQKSVAILQRSRGVDTYANQASRKARLARGIKPEEISDVGNYNVHCLLAIDYLRLQQWQPAAESASYARHIAPAEAQTHELLGEALFGLGKPDDAAISFVASLVCKADNSTVWPKLKSLYDSAGVKPAGVTEAPTGPRLDVTNPIVRNHVTRACAELVRLLREAKLGKEADAFTLRAIKEFGCPPDALK